LVYSTLVADDGRTDPKNLSVLKIERLGGFGGFGSPGSRIRSRGTYPFAKLSQADQARVEDLFRAKEHGTSEPSVPDGFRYRITRATPQGEETIEVPEGAVPADLQSSVKDELQ
jgi:hypothetical protein